MYLSLPYIRKKIIRVIEMIDSHNYLIAKNELLILEHDIIQSIKEKRDD